ncbi:MAG: 50S ribosomal protein L17 [Actinobacteria bacterium RBG_16_67_15]|jgi:large subunit ribosomal protein L17|nr:MAG: 50S ribosomal protein L17 [Actinobacteria bacterium RBG_16_67_15]
MPAPKRGPRFGGDAAHQKAIMSNLAQELFWDEKVTTTIAKAKMLRPYAEKIITRARKGTLHARRVILKDIGDTEVVTKLFDEVAPRYKERPGGYTRIVRIGPRRGDGAEMAIVELV